MNDIDTLKDLIYKIKKWNEELERNESEKKSTDIKVSNKRTRTDWSFN